MKLRAGTIKRVHVDRRVMAANLKYGRADPPITVQTSARPYKAHSVLIRGASRFIYSPAKPLSCGARLWIETRAALELSK